MQQMRNQELASTSLQCRCHFLAVSSLHRAQGPQGDHPPSKRDSTVNTRSGRVTARASVHWQLPCKFPGAPCSFTTAPSLPKAAAIKTRRGHRNLVNNEEISMRRATGENMGRWCGQSACPAWAGSMDRVELFDKRLMNRLID